MLPTPEQASGTASALISIFAALGSWVVVLLVALVGILLVLHKHGVAWLGEFVTSKERVRYLQAHTQRCDRDLTAVRLELAAVRTKAEADLAEMRAELHKRDDTIEDLFQLARDLRHHFNIDRRRETIPTEPDRRRP